MRHASTDLAVRLAILAVLLELTVSANLLTLIGIPYVSDGGSLPVKLHPGTDLLVVAFLAAILHRRGWSVLMAAKLPVFFIASMIACLIYQSLLTGTGNLVVLLDTFLPAGLLAVVLSGATPLQLVPLRLSMQVLLAVTAVIALAETVAHATLIPLYLNEAAYHPHTDDFRPTALFDHPLTGSVMAMLGLTLTPTRGRLRLVYAGLMWASLLAYGGRVALASALAMVLGSQMANTARLVLNRDPAASRMLVAAGAALVLAALLGSLALAAGLGTRLAGHLYWDDSAQVRLAQWQLLDQLDGWQMLFGTRREDLLALLTPLRLGTGVEVIENFWLLMFVGLGALGFPLFVAGLAALLIWGWRRTRLQGRLLILGVMLVASTSNSLGRKSTILVCLVATIACLPLRLPMPSIRRAFAPGDARTVAA